MSNGSQESRRRTRNPSSRSRLTSDPRSGGPTRPSSDYSSKGEEGPVELVPDTEWTHPPRLGPFPGLVGVGGAPSGTEEIPVSTSSPKGPFPSRFLRSESDDLVSPTDPGKIPHPHGVESKGLGFEKDELTLVGLGRFFLWTRKEQQSLSLHPHLCILR